MNKTKTIIGLVAIAVFLVGATYIMTIPSDKYESPRLENETVASPTAQGETAPVALKTTTKAPTVTTPKAPTTSGSTSTTPATPKKDTYTSTEVHTHASSSSCWTIVAGGVYDLTSWISRHPGGSGAIKSMCGVDATADFADQHGGERQAEQALSGYKIGFLQ